jgi:uncharacterized membrane protein
MHLNPRLALVIPWLLIALFSAAYVTLSLTYYHYFWTSVDLAGYAQALYHLGNLELPFNSFKGYVMWGDHAHFILVGLAPLYRLVPDPRLLLVVQVLAVTTAGWALWRVAEDMLKNHWLPHVLLIAYLSFIGIQYALSLDFHSTVLTGALLAWALYAYHFKKWRLYWPLLIAGLTTREDAPTIFFMLGLWMLLRRQWKVGLTTALISTVYFLIVAYAVMPLWTPEHAALTYLDFPDKDPYHILRLVVLYPFVLLQNMFDTPQKIHTAHTLILSFGYLPLLSPFTYLLAAPIFFARFLSPNDYRWLITNHSNANILPVLAWGALFGTTFLLRLLRPLRQSYVRPLVLWLVSVILLTGVWITAWYPRTAPLRVLATDFNSLPAESNKIQREALGAIKKSLPLEDEVAASGGLLAHLANRPRLVSYPDISAGTRWIILSSSVNPWPLNRDTTEHAITQLQKDPQWEAVHTKADIWVFKKRQP